LAKLRAYVGGGHHVDQSFYLHRLPDAAHVVREYILVKGYILVKRTHSSKRTPHPRVPDAAHLVTVYIVLITMKKKISIPDAAHHIEAVCLSSCTSLQKSRSFSLFSEASMQHIKKQISVPDAAHIEAVYIVPKIETLLLVLRILYATHPYGRLVRHHDAA
jgi:hypothetical protein